MNATPIPGKPRNAEGFALIDVIFVCALIGILSSMALPRLLLAKQAAGAASAIGSLRAVNSAELTFALTCGGGFYAPDLPSLGINPPGSSEAFLSANLTVANSVTRSGYIIQLEGTPYAGAPVSCNGLVPGSTAQGFRAAADPAEPSNTRYFATNADGMLWEHTASLWGDIPESGEPVSGRPLN